MQNLDDVMNSIDPYVYDFVSISYPRQLMEYVTATRSSRMIGWNSMRLVHETELRNYLGPIHVRDMCAFKCGGLSDAVDDWQVGSLRGYCVAAWLPV